MNQKPGNQERYFRKYLIGKEIITLVVNLFVLFGFILEVFNYYHYYSPLKLYLQLVSIAFLALGLILLAINRNRFHALAYTIVSYNIIINTIITIIACPDYFDLLPFYRSEVFSRNMLFILILIVPVGFIVNRRHVLIQGALLTVFVLFELVVVKDKFVTDNAPIYLLLCTGFCYGLYLLVSIVEKFLFALEQSNVHIKQLLSSLQEKNKEILSSINYARRLQSAILPPNKLVEKYLINSFILYKPKDIVAGDFYWMEVADDNIIFALADCTGHGVPGAMVSMVCHNALNRAVREFNLTDPGLILDKTSDHVIDQFNKSEESVADGMDIALCVYNRRENTLKWAAANCPVILVSEHTLFKLEPDNQPIGNYVNRQPFRTHTIDLKPGDQVYLFSDGYIDQFGGPNEKKLNYRRFFELIMENHNLNISEQKLIFEKAFDDWKGKLDQIDDVCMIGIRFD
jgi:serine phosphatase RsbU (regulator of sigma subunit)